MACERQAEKIRQTAARLHRQLAALAAMDPGAAEALRAEVDP